MEYDLLNIFVLNSQKLKGKTKEKSIIKIKGCDMDT